MKKFMMFLMSLVLCTMILSNIGCSKRPEDKDFLGKALTSDFRPDLTFKTVSEIEKVDGMEIGRVIVKIVENQVLLSALVTPPTRKLPIGSQVKLSVLKFNQGNS